MFEEEHFKIIVCSIIFSFRFLNFFLQISTVVIKNAKINRKGGPIMFFAKYSFSSAKFSIFIFYFQNTSRVF